MDPISTGGAPRAIGPYSQGARAGSILATSGQIPIDPATGAMPDSIEDQARLAISNALAVVAAGGEGWEIVSVRIFLADMADFAAVNRVYEGMFAEPHPARSCVAVSAIPKGAKIEVEALAVRA
ncbi:MAG: Rid family detoxifying hydrolase [Candidatus Methanoplasma sp.]|jgi:2-iminobutanoate/2-iminopropanoate deaminase|nr:Rid family detoxifying hydrolase [Candidatus Methanoplasma sp.]